MNTNKATLHVLQSTVSLKLAVSKTITTIYRPYIASMAVLHIVLSGSQRPPPPSTSLLGELSHVSRGQPTTGGPQAWVWARG